ncbi:MAG TPA: DUF4127 family protein [Candidatus Gastranaerophilaceae bacterium]|nr:DUF4127 family protein [Candidatus Gastranaerophilaceae bacterium]HPT41315.1 DUF4127 family protein [Candidatus Gastranaerophilaceae bacterium]
MKKIALIPIDNRPVCYTLPEQIAKIDENIKLFMPDRKFLGGLNSQAKVKDIFKWLKNLENVDAIIISLDTIAYGGLISSRRCPQTFDEIKSNLEKFKKLLEQKNTKIYAFSSIMRISNNNINEEEKEYWNKYGKKIFKYSRKFHEEGIETKDVPKEILSDYLATRQRNFEINKIYLEWIEEGVFDTLVFSKDDCAPFGLNVLEAQILKKMIEEKKLNALVKIGADEIPLTLLARAVVELNRMPKISVKFLAPEHKDLISNYEDISIKESVEEQLKLAGCKIVKKEQSEIELIVNNFEQKQGEIVMEIETIPFSGNIHLPPRPYMIADVRFANGADNAFVEKLFKAGLNFENFYGYSAWNTSANTLGSLICAAIVRFFAKKYNENEFKKLQFVRFADDWAYQANVRQSLKNTPHPNPITLQYPSPQPSPARGEGEQLFLQSLAQEAKIKSKLNEMMSDFENRINKKLNTNFSAKYSYPWDRFFEVDVMLK